MSPRWRQRLEPQLIRRRSPGYAPWTRIRAPQNQGAKVGAPLWENAPKSGGRYIATAPRVSRTNDHRHIKGIRGAFLACRARKGSTAPSARGVPVPRLRGRAGSGQGPSSPGDRELPEGRAAAPDVGGGNRTHYRRRRATQATLTGTAENTSKSSSRSAECKAR